jgi:hypothetical protein
MVVRREWIIIGKLDLGRGEELPALRACRQIDLAKMHETEGLKRACGRKATADLSTAQAQKGRACFAQDDRPFIYQMFTDCL